MDVVTDEDQGARVILQGLNDRVDARHVEVRGGLVEQQKIGGRKQELDQGETALFSSAQDLDLLEDVVALEEKGAEQGPYFLGVDTRIDLVHGFVQHASFHVENVHPLLGKISNLDIVSEFTASPFDGDEVGQDLEEGGFAGSVRPDQDDPFLLFDFQVKRLVHQVVAVSLSDLGKGGYSLSAPRGLGETEGQGFLGFPGPRSAPSSRGA